MIIPILTKGLIIGFSIAAVVGPIGVLCLRRSITQGFSIGLATGIGAALADAMYGAVAAFGLTIVSDSLLHYKLVLKIFGSSYLFYLGIRTFTTKPTPIAQTPIQKNGLINSIISTFFLTITSPVTILAFITIFTGFGLQKLDFFYAWILVLGVFLGSTMWWILLSSLGSFLGRKLELQTLVWVNRISGIIITLFGIVTLIR